MNVRELIVYRNFEEGKILQDMAWVINRFGEVPREESHREEIRLPGEDHLRDGQAGMLAQDPREAAREMVYGCIHGLLELAEKYGFHGNLWHCYLTDLLVNHENSYSCACELRGAVEGTINQAALHDIAMFKDIYDYDFAPLCAWLEVPEFALVEQYEGSRQGSKMYNARICARICDLAERLRRNHTAQEMKDTLTEFYREYGVGKFGLHKSFRICRRQEQVRIEPIRNIAHVCLDDLVGYEIPKRKLRDNTDAFVEGRSANNCLLFGDAGTGKSSCIKAIANEYYEKGLRIIEIYRHQFQDLNQVISQIKNRNYKFILYMDDLSFEEFETEYKYLKAVIEGGLEKKPGNVLIYATSNRRHLIRENYRDKEEIRQDMHTSDTVQEKLSLANRFGVTIYFGAPDKKQFQQIVEVLAHRGGVGLSREELLAEANKWELSHGGLSGRSAQQFIDDLLGRGRCLT